MMVCNVCFLRPKVLFPSDPMKFKLIGCLYAEGLKNNPTFQTRPFGNNDVTAIGRDSTLLTMGIAFNFMKVVSSLQHLSGVADIYCWRD